MDGSLDFNDKIKRNVTFILSFSVHYFIFFSASYSTKAAADSCIRRDFLQPAAECATTPTMKIKAFSALGKFSHRYVRKYFIIFKYDNRD